MAVVGGIIIIVGTKHVSYVDLLWAYELLVGLVVDFFSHTHICGMCTAFDILYIGTEI
jgi:hypothetical protein